MPAIFKNNKNYGGNSPLIINDESYSIERVWSSDKVNSELLKLSNELKELIGEEDKVEITYEDYNNLTDEEKNNGKIYYITDSNIIAFKGVEYGGGGSAKEEIIELTYAEYQALSTEEKNNGITYFINDIDSEVPEYSGGTAIQINEENVISLKDIKKNYIDNSNFRINQTGATEYSTADEYTVDRWYIDGGILTPVENGVQFVNTNTESGSTSLVRLKQNIGYSFEEFMGKTVTLSAKINDTLYSGTATIPTEKPTEGTAVQYVTVGVPAFGINLNYSITGDYFVPYIALAYNTTIMVEWMKLEVNDEFSGYIEPDYATELIKINLTTSTKGNLDLPYTKDEVNTAIKAVIDDTSEGSEGSTWSSNKIVEQLNYNAFSDYERLVPTLYSPVQDTIFVGYSLPSFYSIVTGTTYDFIVANKRDEILHRATIIVQNDGYTSSIDWVDSNKPSDLTLFSNPAQANSWKILGYIYRGDTFLAAKIADYTSPTTVSGYNITVNFEKLITFMDVYGKYNIYIKQIN